MHNIIHDYATMKMPQYTHSIPSIQNFGRLLLQLLDEAAAIKRTSVIATPLTGSDFVQAKSRITDAFRDAPHLRVSGIEVAAREIFVSLVANTDITQPEFTTIWNLLDIMAIICDAGLCESALALWLIEDLFESQTISGCRTIFDFLEVRRERLTAKDFDRKHYPILRFSNELLRRLSRITDAALCGRVYIFLFQTFPLGDKSSVNTKGDYHVENVTNYDKSSFNTADTAEKMEIDDEPAASTPAAGTTEQAPAPKAPDSKAKIDLDELYPVFWSLQDVFSQPKKLFDKKELDQFKKALEMSVNAMKVHSAAKSGMQGKQSDESKFIAFKKKAMDREVAHAISQPAIFDTTSLGSGFNPQYLTSRHLFQLEISDLSFQRHVLVQALIIMDFLLAQSEPEKEKLAHIHIEKKNQHALYPDQVLAREDTKWAQEMRRSIQEFLADGPDGALFHRMVQSILSRDKNWVRWKIESCPPISLPPITPEAFNASRATVEKITSKRPRQMLAGNMEFDFLEAPHPHTKWDNYKDPKRFKLPDLKTYDNKIATAKLDVEMAMTEKDKAHAEEVLAAQTWRAMRIARSSNIALFDKVDDYRNVDAIFKGAEALKPGRSQAGPTAVAMTAVPADTRAMVTSDDTYGERDHCT